MVSKADTRIGSERGAPCLVCDGSPVVLVALHHPAMRRWTEELLTTVHSCWSCEQLLPGELLVDAIARISPDLVVVDELDFPACCREALDRLPSGRVVTIGPEPDGAYRSLALSNGAAGWVSRDHLADELSDVMRAALGCRHDPCPADRAGSDPSGSDSAADRAGRGTGIPEAGAREATKEKEYRR